MGSLCFDFVETYTTSSWNDLPHIHSIKEYYKGDSNEYVQFNFRGFVMGEQSSGTARENSGSGPPQELLGITLQWDGGELPSRDNSTRIPIHESRVSLHLRVYEAFPTPYFSITCLSDRRIGTSQQRSSFVPLRFPAGFGQGLLEPINTFMNCIDSRLVFYWREWTKIMNKLDEEVNVKVRF